MSEQQEHDTERPAATAEMEAEIARLEDRFKRALADLDNYRKRSTRELERRTAQATDAVLTDWLEVADSVERALDMTDDGSVGDGLRAVREQIEATLARQHVERLGAAGEPFDPDIHEAVDVRPSTDVPDRTIVEVVRPGYAREGRVLRPALVAVAQRPRAAAATDQPAG